MSKQLRETTRELEIHKSQKQTVDVDFAALDNRRLEAENRLKEFTALGDQYVPRPYMEQIGLLQTRLNDAEKMLITSHEETQQEARILAHYRAVMRDILSK